jgi:hypothetical protein
MNKILLRAITAFSRTDLKGGDNSLQIEAREINYLGKSYVALESESSGDLLALYRCMNRGELKRLKRWPAELTQKEPVPQVSVPIREFQKKPAILELSPIKSTTKRNKSEKLNSRKLPADLNQTDLFE